MTENEEMTAEEIAAIEEEERARIEAEERARIEAEERARIEAEEQARLEAEERARLEHEAMLAAFPDTTVFYNEIIYRGEVKSLGTWTKDAHAADLYGWIANHMDEADLTFKPNATAGGIYYLKGYEPAAETPAEYIARREEEIKAVVQTLIDKTAHQKGYDNGVYCASYVGDPDPEFDAQARAFLAWRGRCWRTCYNILASVTAGTVAPEDVTDEYVLERLPIMEWPEL